MFSRLHLSIAFAVLMACFGVSAPAGAQYSGSQFSLSLDGMFQCVVPPSPYSANGQTYGIGAGGNAFFDWRPFQFISIGIGGQYTYFTGNSPFKFSNANVGGRLFPFGTSPAGEFYLQGGYGKNLLTQSLDGVFPGDYHGYGCIGYRSFISPSAAMDLGLQYDYDPPYTAPLQAASFKVGLTFLFGRTDWRSAKPITALKQNTVEDDLWKKSSTYAWQAGDNLRSVSQKLYGDPALYPLIVDANKTATAHPDQIKPGTLLTISSKPSGSEDVTALRSKSEKQVDYVKLAKISELPMIRRLARWNGASTYNWKKGDTLQKVAKKLYGNEDLYPLLVDANQKHLILPANLVPGTRIKVPKPNSEELDKIQVKGWSFDPYIFWRNVTANQAEHMPIKQHSFH